MQGALLVAAGGGGDIITGAALSGIVPMIDPPVVMTYSWDRLMIDPAPGPRTAADFTGLQELAPHVFEVLPSSTAITPAASSLPRLSADLPIRILLLDPLRGAAEMAAQIRSAAKVFEACEVVLVDVGGDVLTDGMDPGLRSPLADQLALAACVSTGLPARLLIAAPGVDGELPSETVLARLRALDADQLPPLSTSDFAYVDSVFEWHPSEASGLLAAAAAGHRGLVEIRDAGDQVSLTDETTAVFSVDARSALEVTPATRLTGSRALTEAEAIIAEMTGISEIRYEARKAARLRGHDAHRPSHEDLPIIDRIASEVGRRGAHYISMRRLAELVGVRTLDSYAALSRLLATERATRYERSVYRAT